MFRHSLVIAAASLTLLAACTLSAQARGGHGARNAPFASGRRHGNDSYIKAASEERERLLETKLKSICRGC